MPPVSLLPFVTFATEAAVGRMLAGYSNLEIGLFNCVQVAVGDFDGTFKAMFRQRGEIARINIGQTTGQHAYAALGLDADFQHAIDAMRHARLIRNQYAHWTFWDDHSGNLAFANLEDLARVRTPVADLTALGVFHINAALVQEQESFFVYVDRCLSWANYEGRYVSGALNSRIYPKPAPVAFPPLRL